jgi:hypothetical protein
LERASREIKNLEGDKEPGKTSAPCTLEIPRIFLFCVFGVPTQITEDVSCRNRAEFYQSAPYPGGRQPLVCSKQYSGSADIVQEERQPSSSLPHLRHSTVCLVFLQNKLHFYGLSLKRQALRGLCSGIIMKGSVVKYLCALFTTLLYYHTRANSCVCLNSVPRS